MMPTSRRLACGGAARRSGVSSRAASAGISTADATSGTAMAEVQRSAKDTRTTGNALSTVSASCSVEILITADDAASPGILTEEVVSTGEVVVTMGVDSAEASAKVDVPESNFVSAKEAVWMVFGASMWPGGSEAT